MLGSLFEGIDIDVAARLSPDDALDAATRLTGTDLGLGRRPELAILPHPDGSFRLVYPVRVFTRSDLTIFYVDARTGAIAWSRSDLKRQAAAGIGTGVLGDAKKMSVRPEGAAYVADDMLRPPSLVTFDLKGDIFRALNVLNGTVDLRSRGPGAGRGQPVDGRRGGGRPHARGMDLRLLLQALRPPRPRRPGHRDHGASSTPCCARTPPGTRPPSRTSSS